VGPRHADFATWQPPEEENDDQPILGDGPPGPVPAPVPEAELGEIYMNLGRREGVRASDVLRLLQERAGVDRSLVRRIRVRDRHTFATVPKADLARIVEALAGATIGDRPIAAEQARERNQSDEGPADEPPAASTEADKA
jgi:ATP-dependent RNA helicase DeaD